MRRRERKNGQCLSARGSARRVRKIEKAKPGLATTAKRDIEGITSSLDASGVRAILRAAGRVRRPLRVRLDVRTPSFDATPSARLVDVGLRFGVPLQSPGKVVAKRLAIDLWPGSITLIVGPSGSGKSLMLASIARQVPTARLVTDVPFPQDVAVLDAVAPGRPVYDALRILTACGLGEPMLWIRRFHQLSDGERFRARLARAISLHRRTDSATPLLCDEFGAILHRRLAKAIAFNLRKLVTREGLTLVVATSQDDLEKDLKPDTIIRLGGDEPEVEKCDRRQRRTGVSFSPRLRIARGCVRDYRRFSVMHYRRRDQLGFVEKVFVLRDTRDDSQMGIVVFGMPALELRLRNEATGGRFVRNAARLNREVRVLKRLVIHPDIRGCGQGHRFVERALPLAGVRFVECLAAMGEVNPVFDKAGMRRIGTVAPPAEQRETLRRLRAVGADPLAADFVSQVCRRPSVRRIVAQAVFNWYRTTTGGGEVRVERQSPTFLAHTYQQLAGSKPVYFIWAADRKGWAILDRQTQEEEEEGQRPRAA